MRVREWEQESESERKTEIAGRADLGRLALLDQVRLVLILRVAHPLLRFAVQHVARRVAQPLYLAI